MRTLIIGGLLGAGLVTAATALAPVQDEDEFSDLDDSAWTDFMAPTKEQAKRNKEMDEKIQGAWQLVEFETDYLQDYGRHDRGILLIGEGFFSLEMHISFDPLQPYPELPGPLYFQCGTFRYRFDDSGDLLAKQVIGASKDGVIPELLLTRPGSVRVFEVDFIDEQLELSRDEGNSRYVFTRLRNAAHEQLDIYGRPIPPEDQVDEFDPIDFEDPVEKEDPDEQVPPKDDER